MAVVQISRIQIRRGRAKSGTGFPQLASGELGWALDTQELYIGSGSVAEGSPAVGNTKILTQNDLSAQGNLLNLLEHVYKANDPSIITGSSANNPITRFVQDRLDDRVTTTDFGTIGDDSNDDTIPLQRAIDQLFLNPVSKASNETIDGVKTRIILEIPAGTYYITDSLYIPSYATLVGAGSDKTIIHYSGSSAAIKFINDSSTIGNPSTISSTLGNTQPRSIALKGITITTDTDDQICLQLDAVKDSVFDDLKIEGGWYGLSNSGSRGISLDVVSDIVTCENNTFKNISINGFSIGIYSKKDIRNNIFDNININNATRGVSLGDGANESDPGQKYGPRNNMFSNCTFTNVKQQGVYVDVGTNNTITDCNFEYVGNDGGDHTTIEFPQIYFGRTGNISKNIRSDRTSVLGLSTYIVRKVTLTLSSNITAPKGSAVVQAVTGAIGYLSNDAVDDSTITLYGIATYEALGEDLSYFNTTNNLTIAGDSTPSVSNTAVHPTVIVSVDVTPYINYVPEVSGFGSFESFDSLSFSMGTSNGSFSRAFKLPVTTSPIGSPWRAIFYKIDYEYRSNLTSMTRMGTISIVANIEDEELHLTDEYDFIGSDDNNTKMQFRARFLTQTGILHTSGQTPHSIDVQYQYDLSDNGTFTYRYRSTF